MVHKQAPMLLSTVLTCTFFVTTTTAADFYVSPNGNDAGSGTSDSPFATIERARDAVRQLKTDDGVLKAPVKILLRGGTHRLTQPLELTPEDSGTQNATISYEAYPGESPVISGGRSISGWKKHNDTLWIANVSWPKEAEPFTQLFINGQRRLRARTPNEGDYFYTKRLKLTNARTPVCLGLTFFENDLQPWDGLSKGARIVLFHNWVNSYNCVRNVDWERRRVNFTRPAGAYFLGPSIRYYVDNIREGLDAPGEWFFDQDEGRLYYYPLEGEDMSTTEVVVPVVRRTLISVKGDPAANRYVEHLAFRGLSLQHCDADLSPDYRHSVQGAHYQTGVFTAVGLRHSLIDQCEFTHIGEHAVSLLEGCTDNTIRQCHIHDMGGGGIYLSAEHPKQPNRRLFTLRNTIENNFIHDGGHFFRAGCGVFLGGSASYNRILHNDICDMSWMAVHLGWSWTGLQPAYTHHNEVGYNHLHHLGNGVLNDIGGIYTLGVSPGTVLHHNLIHDVTRFERGNEGYGGWGIYPDAGSSELRIENNVVYDTRDGSLHVHNHGHPYGNVVTNNIFAYSTDGVLMRNADHEPEGNHVHLERNIVYNAGPEMFSGNNWEKDSKFTSDKNCFWSESGTPDFYNQTFAQWQAAVRDQNSIIADPGFVDAANRDFQLKPDSPAIALGLKPIDMSTVGLQGPEEWTSLPDQVEHRTYESAVPANIWPLAENFEDYDVDEIPAGALPDEGGARVRITDEQAASGQQSMRFDDASDVTAWKPHWCQYFEPRDGVLRMTCSLVNDPDKPASINLEFRDWPNGKTYQTGPYLQFLPDGTVRVPGDSGWNVVGNFPPGKWITVEIELVQGDNKHYDLKLTATDGRCVTSKDLPMRSPEFERCNWLGFVGADVKEATFYVDNITVE
jgi:parallel beta helix pectate lyase-like protein